MTTLYSCRTSPPAYRITKWVDGEIESSYTCTPTDCDCPAGKRPMCRHREMLPRFLHRGYVDSTFWFDYDRGGWVQQEWAGEEPSSEPEPTLTGLQEEQILMGFHQPELCKPEPHSVAESTGDFDSPSTGSNPVGVAKPSWRRF